MKLNLCLNKLDFIDITQSILSTACHHKFRWRISLKKQIKVMLMVQIPTSSKFLLKYTSTIFPSIGEVYFKFIPDYAIA